MKRSPLKRHSKLKPLGTRAKRMRQGKVAPTGEESAWMAAITATGCIVCLLHYGARNPAEVHHLKDGDRRAGHLASIPLCMPHHRGGAGEGLFISRHPWKKRFEAAYGSELELLEAIQNMLLQK